MEEALGPNYSNGNRAFLQALLASGTMTFEESQPVLAAIMSAESTGGTEVRASQVNEEDFLAYIDTASQAVSLFDYEIRTTLHQATEKRIWALVNTTSDPQTQLATTFGPEELAFIKRLLHAMFDKHNSPRMEVMAVTEMDAYKLARPKRRESLAVDDEEPSQGAIDRGLKHSEVENVLLSLLAGGWLEKSQEGFYGVSPRALLELRPWLTETFNDPDAAADEWQRIKACKACKEILTYGLRCSDPSCTLRLHDMCQDAFWRSRRSTDCTKCGKAWTGENYVGERAVTMTEAYRRQKRRGGPRKSNVVQEIMAQNAEEDEAEDEE